MTGLSRGRIVGILLTVVVVAAVAVGIGILGSPAGERVRQLDQRRVEDLDRIARAVDVYWSRLQRLPPAVEDLNETGALVNAFDPVTGVAYEYRPLEDRVFELCAQFDRPSSEPGRPGIEGFWSHGVGRQCFRREVRDIS
jgi:hypothetical protein